MECWVGLTAANVYMREIGVECWVGLTAANVYMRDKLAWNAGLGLQLLTFTRETNRSGMLGWAYSC
jgi:hypothetical protein